MAVKKVTGGYVAPRAKRTSQGLYQKPKNKHARRNFKSYRGQGHP